jgi:hypothetical protein
MAEKLLTELIDPAENCPLEEWLDRLEDIAEDHGYFEPLGPDHSATFIDRSPSCLLVTFETVAAARGRPDCDVPLGWELAAERDWSQLCLLSHGETWFRHRAVYMYFDRLVDEGFFDEFDHVVFFGTDSAGYAAAAYSVVSPGATVIAISPQATLDPRVTEWDDRFRHMRRTSFTDRYGYAPDMLEAAWRAFILYDPEDDFDAAHAALFTRPNVEKIRCRHFDGQIETFLYEMELLQPLIDKAMAGTLTPGDFHRALRARRDYLPWLRRLLGALVEAERPYLTGLLCRNVLQHINAPRFRRHLRQAERTLEARGRKLPPLRTLQEA